MQADSSMINQSPHAEIDDYFTCPIVTANVQAEADKISARRARWNYNSRKTVRDPLQEKGSFMSELHVLNHPLITHKLTLMRDKDTSSQEFRQLLTEIAMLMGYEVTRNFELEPVEVETPICKASFGTLKEKRFTIVPILRAGLGMVEGLQTLIPFARVGHIGMYRDELTKEPVEYYYKMPDDVAESTIIIVDPMLATGGSACDAIEALKKRGCGNIRMMNLVAAPEGVHMVQEKHPDVDIYIAALDDGLTEDAYITPGLGDAGDRIFGTK
jgi:uracil phosphoribosyltransferase